MYTVKYILKRIALMLLTFVIIMTGCFILIKMLPIVIDVSIGADAELLKAQLQARGYYDPILVQYVNYIKRIVLHGDLVSASICLNFATAPFGTYS